MQRRMRAAEAAVPFVHPKFSVAANVYSFAAQMEELTRSKLMRTQPSLFLDRRLVESSKYPVETSLNCAAQLRMREDVEIIFLDRCQNAAGHK